MPRLLFWAAPSLIGLAIYWPGLFAWFQQDDFACLGLLREVREGNSLFDALFRPFQHGTWRPLGERVYFLLFPWLFGYESWPMRITGFLTQCGSLLLVQAIVLRLTRSRVAAVLAPIAWIVNSKLVIAMTSNGAYTHVLGGFLILLGLYCLISERWIAMWAAFIAGLGAMESVVMFPAAATLYCRMFRSQHLRSMIGLWVVAVAYFAAHMALAPRMAAGSYAMHFDLSIADTLRRYWIWVFVPENMFALTRIPEWVATACAAAGSVILLSFVVQRTRRKEYGALLFLGWFVLLLAPVLPLSGHVTGYYLTIPLAAFGMLAGYAVSEWPRVAAPWLAVYLALSVPSAHEATRWWQQRSRAAERLVRRVFAVHEANPGKTIVLEGVTDEQFWAAIAHYPFVERGKTYVYLAPGTAERLEAHPESGVRMEEFFLQATQVEELKRSDRILWFDSGSQ